ncbi:hypothetical protein KAJ27_19195, partial [bacterium]|nr:hypothetical protein [bacterium]
MKRTFVLVVMVLFVFTAGYSQTATTTTVQSDMFVNNTSGSSASFDEDNPSTELGTDEHSFAFGDTPDGSVPGTTDGEWAEEAAPTWTVTTPSGNEVDVPNESINKDTNSATMGEPNLEVAEEVAGDWEVEEKPTGFEEEDEEIETVKEETPKEPEAPLPPHCPREPGEYTIHNGV